MDLNKSIRFAVDSGKVMLGFKNTLKIALNGEAKLVIVAGNCPQEKARDLKHYSKQANIPLLEFKGTSLELGAVCGKPFPVSALSVLEEGDSDIMKAVK